MQKTKGKVRKMKSTRYLIRGVVGVALIALAGNVQGSIRPFGSTASLSELQGVFNSIGSTIDAANDQTDEALFEPTGAGNSSATYIATVSWTWPELEFGIYNMDDSSQQLAMFNEATVAAGDSVWLTFREDLDLVVVSDNSNPLAPVVLGSTTYFKEFGFYTITDTGSETIGPYFSQDSLNPGGFAHFLTYEGKGDLVTIGGVGAYNDIAHWYIAAEAGTSIDTTDEDFSDMVVQMESITPIPEPASLILLVGTSSLIAFIRHRFIV